MTEQACDILVIGGGPAGSTAAALLAERGRDVVLLEKAEHPRFHIGESLLPNNMPILERLGVAEAVKQLGVFKPGAEFVDDATGRRMAYPFNLSMKNRAGAPAYHVPRAQFDQILFDNAGRSGAKTSQRTEAVEVTLPQTGKPARVVAEHNGERVTYLPRFILDATGRDTLIAGKLGVKEANKKNSTAAVYAHWTGVKMQMDDDAPGFITVHLAEDGWFWMIPLPGEVMSIGFVGNADVFKNRRGSVQDLYEERLARSPSVAARIAGAERVSQIYSSGNYSYRATHAWGEGYMMIGDAFAFLDPVFSSGVLLAMTAGTLGAQVADAWLDEPARGRALAQKAERKVRKAMNGLSWLVYRINSPVLRAMFMEPSNKFNMRDGLIAVLAGNLEIDRKMTFPVVMFKSVYYMLCGLHRLGMGPAADAEKAAIAYQAAE